MQMSGLVFNRLNPRKLREVEKKPTVSTAVRKQPAAFITSDVLLLTVWGGGGGPADGAHPDNARYCSFLGQ